MTRQEVIEILHFCKAVWPSFYTQKSVEEHYQKITEWEELFKDIPRKKVLTAIYTLNALPTHPTDEEILDKVAELNGGVDWPRLKESYLKNGFNWREDHEKRLKEAEA